jgi:signal transduction histidine kinase
MSKPLLEKNTRLLLIWLPAILLGCSMLFFLFMRMQAHHMQEKQLQLKQRNVWNAFVASSGNIDKHITGEYDITEGTANPDIELNEPRDTAIYYADGKQSIPFEILTGQFSWNGQPYTVTTYVSSVEISHLITKVFLADAFILFLLLIAIVILNRKSSGLLWKPFFTTMKEVNNYDITRNQPMKLSKETGTTEFDELNKTLTNLISKVNTAYHNQKQFVENASHEMQTPLAIIRSKLELLINQPGLTEKLAAILGDITEANDRLSQMNRTLLLLAKIENNQFPDTETVNISQVVHQTLNGYKEHYDNFPQTTTNIKDNVVFQANRSLIEILISNLLKNAIEHNLADGKIDLTLSESELSIMNTGLPPEVNPDKLFERFSKGSHQTKTTGLGLALVKQICLVYHYSIHYEYMNGWHKVTVTFR